MENLRPPAVHLALRLPKSSIGPSLSRWLSSGGRDVGVTLRAADPALAVSLLGDWGAMTDMDDAGIPRTLLDHDLRGGSWRRPFP